MDWAFILLSSLYPPHNEVVGGYIGFTPSVRPSVCLSVRPSRIPCPLCSIYSSAWILSIFGTNDQQHERVCRMCWPLTVTYIFKVIWSWLWNRVRSVTFSVLDRLFPYLPPIITAIRGCVACLVYNKILKFQFFANFSNFSAFTFQKNVQFCLHSFYIWYKSSLAS